MAANWRMEVVLVERRHGNSHPGAVIVFARNKRNEGSGAVGMGLCILEKGLSIII